MDDSRKFSRIHLPSILNKSQSSRTSWNEILVKGLMGVSQDTEASIRKINIEQEILRVENWLQKRVDIVDKHGFNEIHCYVSPICKSNISEEPNFGNLLLVLHFRDIEKEYLYAWDPCIQDSYDPVFTDFISENRYYLEGINTITEALQKEKSLSKDYQKWIEYFLIVGYTSIVLVEVFLILGTANSFQSFIQFREELGQYRYDDRYMIFRKIEEKRKIQAHYVKPYY